MKKSIKNSGFTLIETLVSISVLTLAVIGPLTLASYAIRSASVSQNQLTTFYLAQEAMEYIKNKRDNNALADASWLSGMTNCRSANGCTIDVPNNSVQTCSSGCPKLKYDGATGFYNHQTGSDTIFTRQIKFSQISNYEEKVAVTVSWQEIFGAKFFVLEENIFDWP